MDNKKSIFIVLKGLVCLFGLCIAVLAGTTDSYASITCVTCHGRGEVTCSACGGSGAGYGSVRGSCYKCHGSGYESCRYCNGTGRRGADTGSGRSDGGSGSPGGGGSGSSAWLSKTSATLIAGRKLTLSVSGTSKKASWRSSNSSVASVTSKGVVTAKKKGSAVITATVGGKKLTCKIKVTPKVYAKKIKLTVSSKSLLVGEKASLSYKVTPDSSKITESYKVSWKSDNTKVVSVDQKGNLKAKKPGKTRIAAILKSHGKTKRVFCKVTVTSGKQRLLALMTSSKAKKKSDGTRVLTDGDTAIIYNKAAGTYTFQHKEGSITLSTITCPVSMTGTAKIYCYLKSQFSWSDSVYEGKASAKISQIKKDFGYSWTDIQSDGYSSYNGMLEINVLLSAVHVTLDHKLGIGLQDIGFTAYG